jgi:hypothetical protein
MDRSREERLFDFVRECDWLMRALIAARDLELDSWCIGAGAIRNCVWDRLHAHAQPSLLADVDVAYFAPDEASGVEREHQATLERACPGIPWEVTNQAHVHQWFEGHFGHPVEPLCSLSDAVASWPEFATSVGVTLDGADALHVIAPLGLEDLFAMRVRRNPARVSLTTYRARVVDKQYRERWPRVDVVEE